MGLPFPFLLHVCVSITFCGDLNVYFPFKLRYAFALDVDFSSGGVGCIHSCLVSFRGSCLVYRHGGRTFKVGFFACGDGASV